MKKMKNNKGFTLTELIVVIVIIGVLAAVLVPSLTSYISKARDAAAIQEASNALTEANIELAFELANGGLDDGLYKFTTLNKFEVVKVENGADTLEGAVDNSYIFASKTLYVEIKDGAVVYALYSKNTTNYFLQANSTWSVDKYVKESE